MYLACTTLGLTLEQAITAATINAAYSVNLSHRVGAITEGRQGDFVVINTKRLVIWAISFRQFLKMYNDLVRNDCVLKMFQVGRFALVHLEGSLIKKFLTVCFSCREPWADYLLLCPVAIQEICSSNVSHSLLLS